MPARRLMGEAMGFARSLCLLAAPALLLACASTQKPWRTYEETVRSGERERVASHGRWERENGKCTPEAPPTLEIVERPSHGRVEFRGQKRKPKKCDRKFVHMSVYYRADAGFVGEDRFSYHRIDPDTGRSRLAVVEVRVKAPKRGTSSTRSLPRDSIRTIQELLAAGGYEPGPADALAGRQTRAAISRYQKARGIPVTGAPSPELLERLRGDF